VIWAATVLGNIGTFMRDVTSAWLVTDISVSPAAVAMVQAAGTLPITWGLGLMPVLAVAGLTAAYIAGGILFVVLYAALSISYSLDLKKRSIYDVFALAALYTVRMYGGGEMSEHTPSAWLLAFSVFLFLGLALMKRVAELIATETNKLKRRGYRQVDQPLLMAAGVASSFGACLVLAIYLDSNEVRVIYEDPFRLWVILPLMLFWQLKLWHYTIRGKMTDDPIVFAAKDRISWIIGGFCLAAAVLAGY
jgi:4-hydroxybenzoate polyprenyltransferase